MKIKKINQSAGVVASVVNSLTSDSTTDALSAKQGKELKNLIDNIEVVGGGLDSLPINTIIKYDGTEIPEGWEEVHEINIITARTNNNSSAVIGTAYEGVKIPLTNIEYILGNGFELLADGTIKINITGYYKINANVSITGATDGAQQIIQLMKNTTRINVGYQYSPGASYVCVSLSPRVIYAEAGDIIQLQASSNKTGTYTIAGGAYTYVTVEEI